MRLAVQSSLADEAGVVFSRLCSDQQFWQRGAGFLQSLAQQIVAQNRKDDVRLVVEALSELPAEAEAFATPVITELVRARSKNGTELAKLAADGKLSAFEEKIQQLITRAFRRVSDGKASSSERVAAIELVSLATADRAIPVLSELIDSRESQPIQQAAMIAIGRYQHESVAQELISAWPTLSPRSRETASEILFARPERTKALFGAVESGALNVADLARTRLQTAARSRDAEVSKRALGYLKNVSTGRRDEVMKRYRASLDLKGDWQRGRAAFKQHCSVCHKVEGVGHELGPNLVAMKTRGADAILSNVIDPNAEVNPQYLNYVVVTEDGNTLTGMITAESSTAITLTRQEGARDTVLRVDVDTLQSTGVSLMPEGLEEKIDVQTMADIITYLMQAK